MAQNEIDPRFYLPPHVVDLSYKKEVAPSDFFGDSPAEFGEAEIVEGEVDATTAATEGAFNGFLSPPDSISIISQSVKVTTGGAVVDIVIDVDDPSGVGNFEVRVTKQ